jgi:thioredoxin 1
MGTQSIPVFQIAEELETQFPNVQFFDMEFDNPESHVIINLPEVQGQIGIPVVVYYKNGSVLKATAGIQTKVEISGIIENLLLVNENVHIDQLTQ